MDRLKSPRVWGAVILALILFVIASAIVNRPAPPTPPPTKAPTLTVNGLGGQVFLRNSRVKEHLQKNYNLMVDFKEVGTFDMVKADLTGVDFVWPGSAAAFDEFAAAKGSAVKKSNTVFRTYNMLFTWRRYVDPLKKAGIVLEKEGAYFMKMEPVIKAMNEDKQWKDIGLLDIPGYVNVVFSDPERSSGGLTFLTLLADYQIPGGEAGGKKATRADLPPLLPSLVKIWEKQGRQDKASPEQFEAWVQRGEGVPLAWSSESLYLGWRAALPEKYRKDADRVVGVYPEWTISNDHVLVGLTPNGVRLVEIFSEDKVLQEIGWVDHGMRTRAAGVSAKAGDTDVPWIAASPLFMPESTRDVTEAIREAIKQSRSK